jgi:hypothetical protein
MDGETDGEARINLNDTCVFPLPPSRPSTKSSSDGNEAQGDGVDGSAPAQDQDCVHARPDLALRRDDLTPAMTSCTSNSPTAPASTTRRSSTTSAQPWTALASFGPSCSTARFIPPPSIDSGAQSAIRSIGSFAFIPAPPCNGSYRLLQLVPILIKPCAPYLRQVAPSVGQTAGYLVGN